MPGHMSGQIVFGQALYEAGEFEEARQVFERALTLDPENLIALRTLGDLSLQSGNTGEARNWYIRLLDADPKDTAVIALVSEIDASADAAPVAPPQEIPVDTDAGDQPIPYITDDAVVGAAPEPAAPQSAAPETPVEPEPAAAPQFAARENTPAPPSPSLPEPETTPAAQGAAPAEPPAGLERHYPEVEPIPDVPLGTEGLHSHVVTPHMGAAALRSIIETPPTVTEGLRGEAPTPEPVGTEGLKGKPEVSPLAGAAASRSDDDAALDAWTPPPGANVHERVESRKEDRMFSGAGPEPFVNETMAQLYLQQGYRQLALKVYYQLAEARPNDQGLKDRIAEIEAADRAAHPEDMPGARREPSPIERPSPAPSAPRSPSIEAPTPGGAPESEETPSFDRTPIDSPPSRPSRERESVEYPTREEPVAEPEGIAARQPSIKEFFATLGRRRAPRPSGAGGGGRAGNSAQNEPPSPLATAAPGASLDAVFAGATVNPSDSRAASRLAGAFSSVPGGGSRTPPTPPMPTPRVNPRMPHSQESEEDVAKFRAWLDGLTGE